MSLELLLWIVAVSGFSLDVKIPLYGLLYGRDKNSVVWMFMHPVARSHLRK